MKRIYIAAGAVLLGSSAFAWAPSTPTADTGKPATVAVDPAVKSPPPKVVPKLSTNTVKREASSASWIADDQSVDTTPQPAAGNYPPCSPGPGDDHCIQLYERGVRAQLAAWDKPTGTLAANSATDAVGGPYEPVDASQYTGMGGPEEPIDTTLAMSGDGAVDAALGETAADEGTAAAYTGMGGPLEEVSTTAYPPCRPGPGDDRCIQLYERGVTGR